MAEPVSPPAGDELLTEIDGPIARITFNRPQARNALTASMLVQMADFLVTAEADARVRCIVLTGAGEHFMAGGDVSGFARALDLDPPARQAEFANRARRAIPVFEAIERLSKPVIAKVRGAVAGASISWVAAADFVLLSETALFVFAHIRLGQSPDGGLTHYLPRAVGIRKAKELVLLGGRLNAAEAVASGLANRVVPDAELDGEVELLAAHLAAAPGVALARSKRLLDTLHANDLMTQMELEAECFGVCAATDDFAEGVRAFIEKRTPCFAAPAPPAPPA